MLPAAKGSPDQHLPIQNHRAPWSVRLAVATVLLAAAEFLVGFLEAMARMFKSRDFHVGLKDLGAAGYLILFISFLIVATYFALRAQDKVIRIEEDKWTFMLAVALAAFINGFFLPHLS